MERKLPIIDKVKTGQRIRALMFLHGLSVSDIQEYLGLSTFQAVYHWLSGRSLPTIDNLYALSELFHVPLDEIICGNRVFQPRKEYSRLMLYFEKMQYGAAS